MSINEKIVEGQEQEQEKKEREKPDLMLSRRF
jgi:hypothetical protein